MRVERCADQTRETLDGFYTSNPETPPEEVELNNAMRSLIGRLRSLDDPREVFGLTSIKTLILLSRNSCASPWFVRVVGGPSRYSIEYLLPEHQAPWPDACVGGVARSEDEVVRMILIGMEKSGGWSTAG